MQTLHDTSLPHNRMRESWCWWFTGEFRSARRAILPGIADIECFLLRALPGLLSPSPASARARDRLRASRAGSRRGRGTDARVPADRRGCDDGCGRRAAQQADVLAACPSASPTPTSPSRPLPAAWRWTREGRRIPASPPGHTWGSATRPPSRPRWWRRCRSWPRSSGRN